MLAEFKNKANLGVAFGILLEIGGFVLARISRPLGLVGLNLVLVGAVFFIWGCMNYAEGKGHSRWLGFLGLLSFIGIIILVVMPDKHKEG